jgi:hypothetical protein
MECVSAQSPLLRPVALILWFLMQISRSKTLQGTTRLWVRRTPRICKFSLFSKEDHMQSNFDKRDSLECEKAYEREWFLYVPTRSTGRVCIVSRDHPISGSFTHVCPLPLIEVRRFHDSRHPTSLPVVQATWVSTIYKNVASSQNPLPSKTPQKALNFFKDLKI